MKLTPVVILKDVQPFLAQLYIKKCLNNNSERFILLLLSHSLCVRGLHPHLHFWKPLICRTWVKQPFSSFSETVTHPSWLSWCSAGLPVPTHVFSSGRAFVTVTPIPWQCCLNQFCHRCGRMLEVVVRVQDSDCWFLETEFKNVHISVNSVLHQFALQQKKKKSQ